MSARPNSRTGMPGPGTTYMRAPVTVATAPTDISTTPAMGFFDM
ncbi:hypothetical protein [Streptomyces sp. MB09-02B]|nr:hypothetical protein [Streptomyces sp. MB09-02B]MDX3639840.1 hypothetical protein [Streptomyces sp. MB09-02B]